MNDARDRYLNDPIYHAVVDHFRSIIRSATLTPSEVREAAMMACVIEEQYTPARPFSTSDAELEQIRRVVTAADEIQRSRRGEDLVLCETCGLRVPERLATFGVGVRGGAAARCAACKPQPGRDGEMMRLEVIELRRARSSTKP